MSEFKNFFPTKLDPRKREFFTSNSRIKTYKIYAYILRIFCLFKNFPRTRGKYSKVFDLFAFEIEIFVMFRIVRIVSRFRS